MTNMRMESARRCILCGRPGEPSYRDLHDRVFPIEGSFSYRICHDCGLIWMDPRPVKEDLGKCYRGFYSPDAPVEDETRQGFLARVKATVRGSIFCGHYGYRHIHSTHPFCAIGMVLRNMPYVGPAATYGWESLMPHFKDVDGASVVDVGCGRGEFLRHLKSLGCKALGIEPDETAYAILKRKGLDVFHGTLEDAHLPYGSVAHISMRHVIEHLPDPVNTINECYRVLRPGGRLVLRLPNGASLNHVIFKNNWYQLDPPRHLYIFSPKSISILWRHTAFASCRIRTLSFSAKSAYDASAIIKRFGALSLRQVTPQAGRWPLTAIMHLLTAMGIPCGEDLEAVLVKR